MTSRARRPRGQPQRCCCLLAIAIGAFSACRTSTGGLGIDAEAVASGARVETTLVSHYKNVEELTRKQRESPDPAKRFHAGEFGETGAFASPNRAVVRWYVRYDCGLNPAPAVGVGQRVLRFAVTLAGKSPGNCGHDISEYQTEVTKLPSGRYRIVGVSPGIENIDMMLNVPEN